LRGEFDGYMAVISSFGIAKDFTYKDLELYKATNIETDNEEKI
jgi:hypothetical protein